MSDEKYYFDIEESRWGRFALPGKYAILFSKGEEKYVAAFKKLFSEVFIVRCEHLFHTDSFEYVAWSTMFRPLKEGEAMPAYVFEYDKENGSVKCTELEKPEIREVE